MTRAQKLYRGELQIDLASELDKRGIVPREVAWRRLPVMRLSRGQWIEVVPKAEKIKEAVR